MAKGKSSKSEIRYFWNFDSFPNRKNSEILKHFLVVKFRKFINFPLWNIPEISNLENSKN